MLIKKPSSRGPRRLGWPHWGWRQLPHHMSMDGTKSALAWLTAGNTAVVFLEFAQIEVVQYHGTTSKKSKATALTTTVDHGKMSRIWPDV